MDKDVSENRMPVGEMLMEHESGDFDAVYDSYNKRLKLFGLDEPGSLPGKLLDKLMDPGSSDGVYSKLIVYAYPGNTEAWADSGLRREGVISGFFGDSTDAVIWAGYTGKARGVEQDREKHEEILRAALSKEAIEPKLPDGYTSETAKESDAEQVAELLRRTFPEYPTSLETEHIRGIIYRRESMFRMVRHKRRIVALASAELDRERHSAELTDCATSPESRRKGFMLYILSKLREDVRREYGITDTFSLCRAGEWGINIALARLGMEYTGRLINNCRMPDGWESMNIWCGSGVNE